MRIVCVKHRGKPRSEFGGSSGSAEDNSYCEDSPLSMNVKIHKYLANRT